jgi:hypothetical protein
LEGKALKERLPTPEQSIIGKRLNSLKFKKSSSIGRIAWLRDGNLYTRKTVKHSQLHGRDKERPELD